MKVKPTQKQVDAVASFVEACDELGQEPFLGPDEKLSFSHAGTTWTFQMGDRCHFRSALISFRRIWMPNEPSHVNKVANIIQRCTEPGLPQEMLFHHLSNVEENRATESHIGGVRLSGERIVNLWLNTVFAHGGIEGKNKRQDFEAAVDQFGHAFFEYVFRTLVRSLVMEYRNISQLAANPSLLKWKEECGLSPSFRMGAAFGTRHREKTKEGHIVIRRGSSEYFTEETFEERYRRILSRHVYRDFKRVLEGIQFEERRLILAVLRASSFADLMQACEGELRIDNTLSPDRVPALDSGQRLSISTGIEGRCQPGPWSRANVYEGPLVVTNTNGQSYLDDFLSHFKKSLIEE